MKMIRCTCLVLLAALGGCGKDRGDWLPGYVEGEFIYVSSPIGARLDVLSIARGVEVQSGAPLFELDSTAQRAERDAAEARLAQAQAALRDVRKGQRPTEIEALQATHLQAVAAQRLAEAELARQQKLLASGVGSSQQDVDRARAARDQAAEQASAFAAQLKTAQLGARSDQVSAAQANVNALEAELARAEWELQQTRQSAPAEAMVVDTLFRVGEWVPAGRPIASLLPPGNIKVRTFVPEPRLGVLRIGDEVRIHVDGVARELTGSVRFIAPRAEFTPPVIYSESNRDKLVTLVEIALAPSDAATLHPGQPVDVQFVKR